MKDWLEQIARYRDQWSLTLGARYAESAVSYVVRADRADGTAAVLKLKFPVAAAEREVAALDRKSVV